jgi:superfamily II helicase
MRHRKRGSCEICGKWDWLENIYEQVGGKYHNFDVCPDCAKEHERELELTRQNFQRQFGEN